MIDFHLRVPRGDRRHYVDDTDVAVVLSKQVFRDHGRDCPDHEAYTQVAELLRRAVVSDPTSFDANLRLGWASGHLGRHGDARHYIARALRHGELSVGGLSALADAHADWGFLDESERLFEKALALEPGRARTLRDHARAVWDLGPHTAKATSRALMLFERALAAAPDDVGSHLYFARALAMIPGENARALLHAERALVLRPDYAGAGELVAQLRKPLGAGEAAHLRRQVLSTRRFDRRTGEVIEGE